MSRTNLIRNLRVGDILSLEGGRVLISVDTKITRRATLRLSLAEDVVVDKPRVSANDEPGRPRPPPSELK